MTKKILKGITIILLFLLNLAFISKLNMMKASEYVAYASESNIVTIMSNIDMIK